MTGRDHGQRPAETRETDTRSDAHTGPPEAGTGGQRPFLGAKPAGSPWLGAPAVAVAGIEPMTGAPLSELPQRVPRAAGPVGYPGIGRAIVPEQLSKPDDGTDDNDFWLPIEEVHWDGRPVERPPRRFGWRRPAQPGTVRRSPAASRTRRTRHPMFGLSGLVILALAASFFAWVSAEPLWLAVGHGDRGTVTVDGCTGSGLGLRCRGEFTATGGSFMVRDVQLTGLGPGQRSSGARAEAMMIDAGSGTAYAGGRGILHLYWLLGLALILLCGAGIVWVTGASRLADPPARRNATWCGLAAPVIMAIGFVAAAF